MRLAICTLLLVAGLSPAQERRTFTGTITDSMCPTGIHSQMRMGPNDGACTIACIEAHGSTYVLYDGKNAYNLSDQKMPEQFAGKKVVVTGTLDERNATLQVSSILEATR